MPGSRIGPFVAIDLETTGLIPGVDRIVEVGAVRFEADGTVRDRFARLVHPGRPMSPAAERIHGISDAMLADADSREVVLPAFFDCFAAFGLGRMTGLAMLATKDTRCFLVEKAAVRLRGTSAASAASLEQGLT